MKLRMMTAVLMIGAAILLAACGSGGSEGGGSTSVSTIQGQVIKGPFMKGSTVTATQIGGSGRASGLIAEDNGGYSISVPWSGPTKLEVIGRYTDEFTGQLSQTEATLLAALNANAGSTVTAHLNFASTVAAFLVEKAFETDKKVSADTVLAAQQSVAAKIQELLGTPLASTAIDGVPLLSGDPTSNLLLAFHLAVAAALPQSGNSFTVGQQLAKNIQDQKPLLGAAGGVGEVVSDVVMQYLAAMKNDMLMDVVSTGQPVSLKTILNNLNVRDVDGSFRATLVESLGPALSGAPLPQPSKTGVITLFGWCRGRSVAPPPKVIRGETVVLSLKAVNCSFAPNPASMALGLNAVPYSPPRISPPNPVGICPTATVCTLHETFITMPSLTAKQIFVTVQTSGATPLGDHELQINGVDNSTGWKDSGYIPFTVVEGTPVASPSGALNLTGEGLIWLSTGPFSLSNITTNAFIIESDGTLSPDYTITLPGSSSSLHMTYRQPVNGQATLSVQVVCKNAAFAPVSVVPVTVTGTSFSATGTVTCTPDDGAVFNPQLGTPLQGTFTVSGPVPAMPSPPASGGGGGTPIPPPPSGVAGINWQIDGTGTFFDLTAHTSFTFFFPSSSTEVQTSIGDGITAQVRYGTTQTSPAQKLLLLISSGTDAVSGCTYSANGQAPLLISVLGTTQTGSGSITGTLTCPSGNSPLSGTFTAMGQVQ